MSKFIDDKIKALLEGFNDYAQERHNKDGAVGMIVLVAEQVGSDKDSLQWTGQMVNVGSTNMRVCAMSQIFLKADKAKAEDASEIAPEDTPINVLRAAAEFAQTMKAEGSDKGVDEPTFCDKGVQYPKEGCDGRCLACPALLAKHKQS